MLKAAASSICGADHVLQSHDVAGLYEPGRDVPLMLVRPGNVAEVQDLVKLGATHCVPVVALGSGSRLNWGPPQSDGQPFFLIDLTRLADPQSVNADNLTATVGSGTLLTDLGRMLACHGLCWPVDPFDGPNATVGGTVATGASGPSRRLIGPTARWVLGVEAVTAKGDIVTAGGQTVKNVAGYDLTRLLVGSWGTVGLLTAVTLRLAARPAVTHTILLTFNNPSSVAMAAAECSDHPSRAAAVELLDTATLVGLCPDIPLPVTHGETGCGPPAWALLVRSEGHRERVNALNEAVLGVARRRSGAGRVLTEEDSSALWRARARAWLPYGDGSIRGTWRVPRGAVAAALIVLPRILPAKGVAHQRISGHAGDGLLHVWLHARDSCNSQKFVRAAGRSLRALRSAAGSLGGSWRTEIAPKGVWTNAGPDPRVDGKLLFDRLLHGSDPDGIFTKMRR